MERSRVELTRYLEKARLKVDQHVPRGSRQGVIAISLVLPDDLADLKAEEAGVLTVLETRLSLFSPRAEL